MDQATPSSGADSSTALPLDPSGNFDAAKAFESRLTAPKQESSDEQQQEAPDSSETVDEDQPALDALDEEQTADDSDSEDSKEQTEEAKEERRYKVKAAGEEVEVTESELIAGYQKGSDYSKKSAEVAEMRRATEDLARQAMAKLAHADQVIAHFAAQIPEVKLPDRNLIDENPVEFMRQRALYDEAQTQRQQAAQMQQQIANERKEAAEKAQAVFMQQEAEKLASAIPEWKDQAVANKEKGEIAKYLVSIGLPEDALSKINSMEVIVARDAAKYRALMAKAKLVTKKVESAPQRVERSTVRTETNPTDGRTRAMQVLKKSGDTHDAAALFAMKMKR